MSPITDKVMFVDDEPNVLAGIQRIVRKDYSITLANSGEEGLQTLHEEGPFAVVVSDMQMPEMDGAQFLSRVKSVSPDTVRVMLTGNADQETAVTAINQADVFRFLNKPCEREELVSMLGDAIEMYQRTQVEKQLLEETVQGSVQLLAQFLSLSNPLVFGKSQRLADLAESLAIAMDLAPDWTLRTAALLSQIGCINANEDLLKKLGEGRVLSSSEADAYYDHLAEGGRLLSEVSRFEDVAEVIRLQLLNADGTGYPNDTDSYATVPQNAKILRMCLAIDGYQTSGRSSTEICIELERQANLFDPEALAAALAVLGDEPAKDVLKVSVKALNPTMVLAEDVYTSEGVLLVCRGWETNETVVRHLLLACENGTIAEEVSVVLSS